MRIGIFPDAALTHVADTFVAFRFPLTVVNCALVPPNVVIVADGICADIPTVKDDICAEAIDAAIDTLIRGAFKEAMEATVVTFHDAIFPDSPVNSPNLPDPALIHVALTLLKLNIPLVFQFLSISIATDDNDTAAGGCPDHPLQPVQPDHPVYPLMPDCPD
jgi:hypothetical protein